MKKKVEIVIAIPPLNKMQAIVAYKHALYFSFLFFLDISMIVYMWIEVVHLRFIYFLINGFKL